MQLRRPTGREFILQVQDLTLDVQEGQAILSAVRAGAVDAIVVGGPDGDRVYTLQGADESYRILIERMNESALLLSTLGDILYCNRRFSELLDHPMEELCSSIFANCLAESDRPRWTDLLQDALNGEGRGELLMQRRDGTPVPVLASLSRVELHGMTTVAAVFTDLSEQKRIQAQLQELQRRQAEMEHLAAAGRMAARVAHEINNPLGGIKNAFLLVKSAVPDGHRYAHYVPRIESEIDRVARIVHQMFDLCRPLGDGQLHPLSDIVADVIAFQELACRKCAVRIKAEVPGDCADLRLPGQELRQILHNLIRNALDVSPNGGEITLGAASATSPNGVLLSVADQGPGIDEERLPFIFEPFYTTKKAHSDSGLGLGLAICQTLVNHLGGSIDCKARKGRGTVFSVLIPLPCHPPKTEDA